MPPPPGPSRSSEAGPAFGAAGRRVLVPGGGGGTGRVYSTRLAEAGAKVVVADIVADESDAVAKAIRDAGGEALSVPTDVTDPAQTQSMADAAAEKFGRIDGLINNASLMSALPRQSWMKIPLDEWDRVMAVNLRGIFLCCRAVYPVMQKQKFGRIINISSSRFWTGQPNRLHYTTSKAGVIGLTRALAREVGEDNINVNVLAPGNTLSEENPTEETVRFRQASIGLRALQRLGVAAYPHAFARTHTIHDLVTAYGDRTAEALAEAAAVRAGAEDPGMKLLAGLLDQGSAGVRQIPGKRGAPARDNAVVQVVIRDQPGELARLFQVAGQAGVNIEDIGIEHSPGLPVGVAELTVRPDAAARLTAALASAGWPVRR